jgi:broad specificity phosphatase PhoE
MVLKHPNQYQKGKTMVYLIRHGDRIFVPNSPNEGLNLHGPGLSKLGKKQAKAVAKKFAGMKDEIDVFISSSMTRAIETAKEIGKAIKKKPKICDEFSEFNQIVWNRKFHKLDFWKHYLKHRLSVKAFDKILEQNQGKVIVIVAHGNVIKGIIGKKLGLSLKNAGLLHHHNCHISLLRFVGKKLDAIPYMNSRDLIQAY